MKYELLIILIALISCSDDDSVTQVPLEGKWAEIINKMDTMTFGLLSLGGRASMTLSRGKEMRDGFLVPKPGSNWYEYELLADTIALRSYVSSNSAFNKYYFKLTGDKIVTENFYEINTKRKIRIFKKLK